MNLNSIKTLVERAINEILNKFSPKKINLLILNLKEQTKKRLGKIRGKAKRKERALQN